MVMTVKNQSRRVICCLGELYAYNATLRISCIILGLVIALSNVSNAQTDGTDDTDPRTQVIDPYRLSLEIGDSAFVNCSMDDTTLQPADNITSIIWYGGDMTDLRNQNLTGRGYNLGDVDGSVVFTDASIDDSQTFYCVITIQIEATEYSNETVGIYNSTFVYKVYEMPTYLKEGLIILGVNIVLLIVFVACLARSMVADKKRLQKYAKAI